MQPQKAFDQYEDVEQDDTPTEMNDIRHYESGTNRYLPFSLKINNKMSCIVLIGFILLLSVSAILKTNNADKKTPSTPYVPIDCVVVKKDDMVLNKILAEQHLLLNETELALREKRIKANLNNVIASGKYFQESSSTDRPLVLYSYAEDPYSRVNTLYFMEHGLNDAADFLFVINGPSDIDTIIPKNIPNVRYIKRENTCFDLGAKGEVLLSNDRELIKKYKRFILMNSSIKGPFFPTHETGCWMDKFLDRVNDEVKMVGTTYRCDPQVHVQSMVMATDVIGINVLLNGNKSDHNDPTGTDATFNWQSLKGLAYCAGNHYAAIETEISLTNLMTRAGYKVNVLMSQSMVSPTFYDYCILGGWGDVHPYEVIFTKANINVNLDYPLLGRLSLWHDNSGYSSWELCSKRKS